MNKKYKIATVTFHRAINYGAALQTYALQKSIQKLGFDTEVVDYRCDFLEKLHNPYDIRAYRTPLDFVWNLLNNRVKRDNRKKFRDFQKNNIKTSETVYSKEELKNAESLYDAFIVGSDQVWNCNCTRFDKAYFLDFVKDNEKKYSYAASIGIKLDDEELKREYKALLQDFKVLDVREEQGRKELEKIGLDAKVSLDPTLLLDKNEWQNLAIQPKGFDVRKKYLLVYVIVETPSIFETARNIAEEKDLEVVYINEMLFNKKGIRNIKHVSPDEWLWLFLNADFVVTNSFHGTAFSVNFEKQFAVEPLPVKTNVNSRIYDFLNLLKIKNRIVDIEGFSCNEIVDYSSICLDIQREQSLAALKESVELITHEE